MYQICPNQDETDLQIYTYELTSDSLIESWDWNRLCLYASPFLISDGVFMLNKGNLVRLVIDWIKESNEM